MKLSTQVSEPVIATGDAGRFVRQLLILIIILLACGSRAYGAGGACPALSDYSNGTIPVTLTTLSGLGITSCYYIAATGSDTNSGTDESHPWLHAPGMPNCSNACGAITPVAGEGFIFRGGDAWSFGNTAAVQVTGTWNLNYSGSAGHPIYWGVDQSWYNSSQCSGSWCRPILTGGNPVANGVFVSSCSHDNSGFGAGELVWISGNSYEVIDNFEFTGVCWASTAQNVAPDFIAWYNATHISVLNNYFHGWSTKDTTSDSIYALFGSGVGTMDYDVFAFNVVDGSDSSFTTTNVSTQCHYDSGNVGGCFSGGGIYEGVNDVHGNVFNHLSDAMVTTNNLTMHDNLITNIRLTYTADGQHPNCQNPVATVAGQNIYFYNNLVTNIDAPECMWFSIPQGRSGYFFNNIFYDNINAFDLTAPTNCIVLNVVGVGSSTAYFTNNTIDYGDGSYGAGARGACIIYGGLGDDPGSGSTDTNTWNGIAYFQNNHFISFDDAHSSPTVTNAVTGCNSSATCTFTDRGNEIFQTESSANAEGYAAGNNYAPTSPTGATVGQGANLASLCSTYSADSALCSGRGGVSEQVGAGGEVAAYPASTTAARPASGAWDVGAYEFSGSMSGPPVLPGPLNASVR